MAAIYEHPSLVIAQIKSLIFPCSATSIAGVPFEKLSRKKLIEVRDTLRDVRSSSRISPKEIMNDI